MTKGAFRVFRDPDNPRDINFQVASGDNSSVPEEQLSLRNEVDQSLTVLRMMFPSGGERFEDYFRQLLSLSQTGLVGDSPNPKLASHALLVLKERIVAQEGGRIKNQYMKQLGIKASILGIPIFIIAMLCKFFIQNMDEISNFLFLWAGAMVGVWLSFGARKVLLRFEDLHILEQDRLEPFVRLLFTGFLTIAIGLLFSTKMLVVNIGSVETWQFSSDTKLALLFGLLCGFSEKVLSTRIAAKAGQLLPE